MKLARLLTLGAGIAAGFGAARALVDRAEAPALPGPAQRGAAVAHSRLRGARSRAYEALSEAQRVIEESRQELTAEYMRRTGRTDDPTSRRR